MGRWGSTIRKKAEDEKRGEREGDSYIGGEGDDIGSEGGGRRRVSRMIFGPLKESRGFCENWITC